MSGAVLAETLDLPEVDMFSFTSDAERFAAFDRLRAEGHWLARGVFGYTVFDYEDCVAVLRDKRWHNASSKIAEFSGIDDQEFLDGRRESILSAEGDTHTRLRRLVAPAFSPRSADRLRPYMREVVNGLLDAVEDRGGCEFVADVCEPYPIPIMCELLGAPKEDWKLFSVWAADLLRIFDGNLAHDLPLIKRANVELDAYITALIAERRSAPREDLLSELIAVEEAGDRLNEEELLSLVGAVIVGGTDTTRNQLACSVALFTDHPDQWAALGSDPSLANRAVEETMRIMGAVRGTGRFASENIEYRGVRFTAGTFVNPALAVANRDPAVFGPDPHTFDVAREASGQPNLTLGSGIHYCLGAALAKAELQEALPIVARRLPAMTVDGGIDWKPNTVGIWGPQRLPLRFGAS